jgi:hypothetical protein
LGAHAPEEELKMHRYIEPDAIEIDGIFEDLLSAGQGVVNDFVQSGQDIVSDHGSGAAEKLINSTAFKQALVLIRAEAEAGAMQAVKKNAIPLVGFTLAAGAIGGILFKGWIGGMLAATLAGGSAIVLVANLKPPPAAKKKRS